MKAKKTMVYKLHVAINSNVAETVDDGLDAVSEYAYETRADLVSLETDVQLDLMDASSAFSEIDPRLRSKRRVLLHRIVGRAIALLAIDELRRGSPTIERETMRLDVSRRVKKGVKR